MSDRVLQSLVHAVRRRAAEDPAAGSDAQLLSRFVLSRDASAFELLVWRHGAMVEAVCRRVLGRSADVEDAFQATFMALLKQARSIRKESSAAPWLHRVALRVSLKLRQSADRRSRREKASVHKEATNGADSDAFEIGSILHEEIDQLPSYYRLPLVMCFLEGRSVAEVSTLLGVPRGTILSRLSRGRERLRRVLIRRGIAPAIAIALGLTKADRGVSASLVRVTLQSINKLIQNAAETSPVARVAEGVVREMTLKKIRMTVCVAAVVGIIGAGTAFISLPQAQAQPDRPTRSARNTSDLERLQGEWSVVSLKENGRTVPGAMEVAIHGSTITMSLVGSNEKAATYSISLDPTATPRTIDLHGDGRTVPGIYEFSGDNLKLCYCENGSDRPEEFASQRGAHVILLTLKRHPGPTGVGNVAADDIEALRSENARLRQLLAEEKARNAKLMSKMETIQANAQAIQRQIAENANLAAAERGFGVAKSLAETIRHLDLDKKGEARSPIEMRSALQALQQEIMKQQEVAEAQRALALAAQKQAERVKQERDQQDEAKAKAQAERDMLFAQRRLLQERQMQLEKAELEQLKMLEQARQDEARAKMLELERQKSGAAKPTESRPSATPEKRPLSDAARQRQASEMEIRRAIELELQAETKAKMAQLEQDRAAEAKNQVEKAISEARRQLLAERDKQLELTGRMQHEAVEARRLAEANVKMAMAEREKLAAALAQAEANLHQAQAQLEVERKARGQPGVNPPLDAGVSPDCEVEWKGNWFGAKIVKKEKDRWLIHYIGYDNTWDEWVGKDRIRFREKE